MAKPVVDEFFYPTHAMFNRAQYRHLAYVTQVADATCDFINETTEFAHPSGEDLSEDLLVTTPQPKPSFDSLLQKYQKTCIQSQRTENILKTVYIVSIAAVGFILGATVGLVTGALLGAALGPGGLFTAGMGVVIGAFNGAIYGLTIGAASAGVLSSSIATYRFFQPTHLDKKIDNVLAKANTLYRPAPVKKKLTTTEWDYRTSIYVRAK